jgi:hypothetical protein
MIARRLASVLPRHGDRSRLMTALLDAWLQGHITVPVQLKSLSVAQRNSLNNALQESLDARRVTKDNTSFPFGFNI